MRTLAKRLSAGRHVAQQDRNEEQNANQQDGAATHSLGRLDVAARGSIGERPVAPMLVSSRPDSEHSAWLRDG